MSTALRRWWDDAHFGEQNLPTEAQTGAFADVLAEVVEQADGLADEPVGVGGKGGDEEEPLSGSASYDEFATPTVAAVGSNVIELGEEYMTRFGLSTSFIASLDALDAPICTVTPPQNGPFYRVDTTDHDVSAQK